MITGTIPVPAAWGSEDVWWALVIIALLVLVAQWVTWRS
jgi:hypothetical protein